MNPDEKSSKDIIFFLGAGASVEAHIPDTRTLIYGDEKGESGFIQWLSDKEKNKERALLERILDKIDKKKVEIIDVELVLQILHELNNIEKNCIVQFYNQDTYEFKSPEDTNILKELENNLRQFIREKVAAKKENINYLSPLLAFPKPIQIFSVNYDTCIELLCLAHKWTYTDGFELNWQHDLFNKDFDVKLFKLHGSIIWYSTDRHNYWKLPIIQDEISIISGETAKPFILYPLGNKGEFAEPLDALFSEFQEKLKNAMICIVVGYTFRDEDIRRLFFEISQKNKTLKVVLISPNAGKIFDNRLKYFDNSTHTPSTLADKVICWNYTFGAVLKDYYLSRNLQYSIPNLESTYDSAEQIRKEGRTVYVEQFKECLKIAISIDDLGTIETILRKELGIKPPEFDPFFNQEEKFKLLYSLAILHLFNRDNQEKEYFRYFVDQLSSIKVNGNDYFELCKKFKERQDNIKKIVPLGPITSNLPLENTNLLNIRDDIRRDIQLWENKFSIKKFPLFYWWNDEFFYVIKELREYVQIRIKLRAGIIEYSDLLTDIEKICQKFEDLQFSEKYKSSEKIEINQRLVEPEKIQDLLKLFDDFISLLNDFSE